MVWIVAPIGPGGLALVAAPLEALAPPDWPPLFGAGGVL
jgi:hypothetical protein